MGTLAAKARLIFARKLKHFTETITIFKRKTLGADDYDSNMRLVDTSTRWDSGTDASACVSPDPELVQMWTKERGEGPLIREALRIYLKHDVSLDAEDTIVWNGKRYFVKYQPGSEDSYQEALVYHTEGQEQDGA